MPSSCTDHRSVYLMHTLRYVPCTRHPHLTVFDNLLREGISNITNSLLSDIQCCLQQKLSEADLNSGYR